MEIATCHEREVVRMDDGTYTIRALGTNGRARQVPLRADLAEAILERLGHTFPGRINGHISAAYVSKLISRSLPDGLTSEKLRHAYRTGQIKLGWRELAAFHAPMTLRILDVDELRKNPQVSQHVARIDHGLRNDPGLAIGSSKDLLETVFKLLLKDRDATYSNKDDLPGLFAKVQAELTAAAPADAREALRSTLRTLMNIIQNVGATRSRIGTGHGSDSTYLAQLREARLVLNATVAVAEFAVDVWQSRETGAGA